MITQLRLAFILSIALGFCCLATTVQAADTEPPQTQLTLNGTMGANGWYISTVNAVLRASDPGSGVASTTYQIDSNTPVVNTFSGSGNGVLNPSFEDGSGITLTSWDKVTATPSQLYQSNLPSKFGQGSATVLGPSTSFQYWTNANYAVPVSVGQTYTAAVWVNTLGINAGQGAWMEVWERDSSGVNGDQLLWSSAKITGTNDWQLLSQQVTIDSGYDRVYFNLGSQDGDNGQVFFDGATLNTSDGVTQFNMVQNGIHSLTYYSTDVAGNVEAPTTQSPIKIDTVKPQDWSSFGYANTGNNHTFTMWINVRDVTSGIRVNTAQFRTFDDNNCNCWSAWGNVAAVKRVDTGAAASDGYTGYVQLVTPAHDYGDSSSSTFPQVEFQIDDLAGTAGISPIYALFGPWFQSIGGGDFYSGGDVNITGQAPSGQYSSDGVIALGGTTLTGLNNITNWVWKAYPVPGVPSNGLKSYIPNFDQLTARAGPLSGGSLPSTTGVYLFNGTYTIDSNTLNAGFQGALYNMVIIVNGDLAINSNFIMNASSTLVFLVTGNVVYDSSVSKSAGAIIAGGAITTGSSSSQLVHKGTWSALNGITLGRDLGRKGGSNNTDTPAEKIIFPAGYLANQGLSQLMNGGASSDFHWQEVQ